MTSPFLPTADYTPPWWLRSPHVQILMTERMNGRYLPTPFEEVEIALAEGGTCRLVRRKAEGMFRGTILVVHGLGGDAHAGRIAEFCRLIAESGVDAVALGLRGAGGTTPQPRLYHAADLSEIDAAWKHPWLERGPRVIVALSLGANVALRWLALRESLQSRRVDAAVAVCPAAHLPSSSIAISRLPCRLYNAKFAMALGGRVRSVAPNSGKSLHSWWRHSSVRRYDADFAAPAAGYEDPDSYYEGASAHRIVGEIAVPTLVMGAEDDPIVPVSELRSMWSGHPTAELRLSRHGGHLGFIESTPTGRRAGWMPRVIEALRGIFNPR